MAEVKKTTTKKKETVKKTVNKKDTKESITKKTTAKATSKKTAPKKKETAKKKVDAKKEIPLTAKKAVLKKEKKAEIMHKMFSGSYFTGKGKRKTSIARVRIYEKGKGEIIVNGKDYKDYFKGKTLGGLVKTPIKLTNLKDYSITAKIVGGGISAQADALRHGIAKAIADKYTDQRITLKKEGQLTFDSRNVERKKPGRRKARRAQQWVKR
jgi:small subunit ribosomal protein S9